MTPAGIGIRPACLCSFAQRALLRLRCFLVADGLSTSIGMQYWYTSRCRPVSQEDAPASRVRSADRLHTGTCALPCGHVDDRPCASHESAAGLPDAAPPDPDARAAAGRRAVRERLGRRPRSLPHTDPGKPDPA